MTIYAAGAILWREEKGKLLVALIHRNRHNDYSWPKGKVDKGETLPETAVREIAEETGLKIKLGPRLKIVNYKIPNGTPKEVHYWAARVSSKALANSKFKPSEEVESVDWHTPEDARKLLTYKFDAKVLEVLMKLHKKDRLRTRPVIVLRHAKATSRADWMGGKADEEATRPLQANGLAQAKALVPLLGAFGVKRIVTSPWSRCLHTVLPFAQKKKIEISKQSAFTETNALDDPEKAIAAVQAIINSNTATIICSHRPALPVILKAFESKSKLKFLADLREGSTLKPAEMLVIQMTTTEKRKVVSVERYGLN